MGKKIPKLKPNTEWATEENRPSLAQVMKLANCAEAMTQLDLEDDDNGGFIPDELLDDYLRIMNLFFNNLISTYNLIYHKEENMFTIHPLDAEVWVDEETGKPA